ncbi:MAG: peptidoglycan recognition protein [Actinomycetota bacterium]|nr:peptidoglycan recognition protein [Actinomycetota bacterium]
MGRHAGRYRLGVCVSLALLIAVAAVVVPMPVMAAERTMGVETVVPSALGSVTGLAPRLPQFVQSDLTPFQMIGASWTGQATDQVRVRIRKGAAWGPWTPLEADEDDGPDPGSHEARSRRTVTRPLWIGGGDGYELQAPSNALQVHLVRENGPRLRPRRGAQAHAAAAPPIADRGAWGARAPSRPSAAAPSLKMAFVHHTTGPNNYSPGDVPRMLRAMQAYHMDANGWDDIGYNFLVDRFGRMWEGRAGSRQRAIGAHTRGFNTASTGVAVLGTFTRTSPPPASVDGVARVVGWMLGTNGVDPAGSATMTSAGSDKYRAGRSVSFPAVSGHRDGTSTTCPGQRLYDQLPEIRNRARAYGPTPLSPLDTLLGDLLGSVTGALPPTGAATAVPARP